MNYVHFRGMFIAHNGEIIKLRVEGKPRFICMHGLRIHSLFTPRKYPSKGVKVEYNHTICILYEP